MTGVAVTWMIIAMVTVWGGLGLAIANLARHPEMKEPDEAPVEL